MLIEAKSNLARLMAAENLIIEERNVETAYFNLKNRVLTVPILNGNLSPEIYDLLLGHEVGHALETPEEGWHDSVKDHNVNKSILNVCEDVRIEKKIKRKFPGLKLSFIRGYKELMDMDFFGVRGCNLNEMNFIDRVNLHTKGGASQNIRFTEEEQELLSEAESTETWPEVVEVARKIQKFMQEQMEKKKDQQEKSTQTEAVKLPSESNDTEESDELSDDESFSDMNDSSEGISSDTEDQVESQSKKENSAGENYSEEVTSVTDENYRQREKELFDTKNQKDIIYSTIPEIYTDNVIIGYDEILKLIEKTQKSTLANQTVLNVKKLDENYVAFKNDSTKAVSYLVKEFEMRKNADQQKRASVSKTGELNMGKLHEYKLSDDIFKRMTNVPNGKSHGLVMFIDWSGSMSDYLNATIRQLLNLTMFCKKVNIPFEVYAFTSQWTKDFKSKHQTYKVGELGINKSFGLMNLLSNKMTAKEYQTMSKYLLDIGGNGKVWRLGNNFVLPEEMSLGGTPLNSTIVSAFEIVPKFKEKNKLQIVNTVFLTDGESCSLDGRVKYVDANGTNAVLSSDNYPNRRQRSFIRDKKTNAVEEVVLPRHRSVTGTETDALLKLLKQRCECNVIGFFIGAARNMSSTFESFAKDSMEVEKWKSEFRNNGYLIVTNSGYDEYYLIRSVSLEIDDSELEVKSDTTRGFVSAFHKYVGNKISTRIILNRFIGLIA